MGLKKSFLLLSLFCLIAAFLLLGIAILICRGIMTGYPSGGVEILSDGSVIPLPEPTAAQQRVLTILNIIQMACCIIFPVGGLLTSVALFYHIKLKQPIGILRDGITRIQNNDLDFSLPVSSNDEMGQLCAAFEVMRRELLKTNRLLWQQAEERKRLNASERERERHARDGEKRDVALSAAPLQQLLETFDHGLPRPSRRRVFIPIPLWV